MAVPGADTTIGQSLRDVNAADAFAPVKIRQRAADPEHAMVPPGRQAKGTDRLRQQLSPRIVGGRGFFQDLSVDGGVEL